MPKDQKGIVPIFFIIGILVVLLGVGFATGFINFSFKAGKNSSVSKETLQQQANNFLLDVKNKKIDSAYSSLSSVLQDQVSKDKFSSVISELVLADAISVSEKSISDVSYQNKVPSKRYLGDIKYKNPPDGQMDIFFVNENDNWKIINFNFTRSTISETGNLDQDLSEIKKNANFTLYEPTYLPNGYKYAGKTTMDMSNKHLPDDKMHTVVLTDFINRDIKLENNLIGSINILQIEYKIDFASLESFTKSKVSSNQTVGSLDSKFGKAISITSPGVTKAFEVITGDSIISVSSNPQMDDSEALKLINSLQVVN